MPYHHLALSKDLDEQGIPSSYLLSQFIQFLCLFVVRLTVRISLLSHDLQLFLQSRFTRMTLFDSGGKDRRR